MDTRSKITAIDSLIPPDATTACGWFDVLTASHCAALSKARQPGRPLAVLVFRETQSHPTPLNSKDRAQLVAALDCVDHVVICDEAAAENVGAINVDADSSRDVIATIIREG